MHVHQRMWHRPHCTNIYSVRKFANAGVRSFYAYKNFCDHSAVHFIVVQSWPCQVHIFFSNYIFSSFISVVRVLSGGHCAGEPRAFRPDKTPFKGSVERSSLPWAIFLIFTRNRPWKSEDHLCMLFFIEMSKESLEKSERTLPVSWRPWAPAYSRDRPYNFSYLSAVSKNCRFRSFFSALGCHLARKSLSWPAMSVSNKKQEFEQRKRIKLFDDFWVRAYRLDFAPRRRPRARSI